MTTANELLQQALAKPGNHAGSYDVEILPAVVGDGEPYFKAFCVFHLTGEQNGGNHNIYFCILDEDYQPIPGARLAWTWEGRREDERAYPVKQKAVGELSDIPMWGGQVVSVQVDSMFPSDTVTKLHTNHADEPPGNTRRHHSFFVAFKRTTSSAEPEQPEPEPEPLPDDVLAALREQVERVEAAMRAAREATVLAGARINELQTEVELFSWLLDEAQ